MSFKIYFDHPIIMIYTTKVLINSLTSIKVAQQKLFNETYFHFNLSFYMENHIFK